MPHNAAMAPDGIWIDTHAHLDAPELIPDSPLAVGTSALGEGMTLSVAALAAARALAARTRAAGVGRVVIPAVCRANFAAVRELAHALDDAYALGIHPLFVPHATEADLAELDAELTRHRDDPRLVAVGEIGLDYFVPALCTPPMRARQMAVYRAQVRLARRHRLPVLLHVRKSADALLRPLREAWGLPPGQPLPDGCAGIAHAFSGSHAQAMACVRMGLRLGVGGAVTFDTARQLRRLAAELPATALVMETDSPDIPPHWLYATAAQRAAGQPQGINTPAELPRVGAEVARLRGVPVADWAAQTRANAWAALPKLAALDSTSAASLNSETPECSQSAGASRG